MFKPSLPKIFIDCPSTLWENLRDEIQDPKDALQGSSSDDEINETALYPQPERFLVGHGMASKDLGHLHPQPVHIFRLWQTFLVNVNPLVKVSSFQITAFPRLGGVPFS
jgi:hypothetical protein